MNIRKLQVVSYLEIAGKRETETERERREKIELKEDRSSLCFSALPAARKRRGKAVVSILEVAGKTISAGRENVLLLLSMNLINQAKAILFLLINSSMSIGCCPVNVSTRSFMPAVRPSLRSCPNEDRC